MGRLVIYFCCGQRGRGGRSTSIARPAHAHARGYITSGVRMAWDDFPLPGVGIIKLSHDRLTFSAHSHKHEDEKQNPCRLYRNAAKRPLGFLVSWLFVAKQPSITITDQIATIPSCQCSQVTKTLDRSRSVKLLGNGCSSVSVACDCMPFLRPREAFVLLSLEFAHGKKWSE